MANNYDDLYGGGDTECVRRDEFVKEFQHTVSGGTSSGPDLYGAAVVSCTTESGKLCYYYHKFKMTCSAGDQLLRGYVPAGYIDLLFTVNESDRRFRLYGIKRSGDPNLDATDTPKLNDRGEPLPLEDGRVDWTIIKTLYWV